MKNLIIILLITLSSSAFAIGTYTQPFSAGSCIVTVKCVNWACQETGSVECSGARCSRDPQSVTCYGVETEC